MSVFSFFNRLLVPAFVLLISPLILAQVEAITESSTEEVATEYYPQWNGEEQDVFSFVSEHYLPGDWPGAWLKYDYDDYVFEVCANKNVVYQGQWSKMLALCSISDSDVRGKTGIADFYLLTYEDNKLALKASLKDFNAGSFSSVGNVTIEYMGNERYGFTVTPVELLPRAYSYAQTTFLMPEINQIKAIYSMPTWCEVFADDNSDGYTLVRHFQFDITEQKSAIFPLLIREMVIADDNKQISKQRVSRTDFDQQAFNYPAGEKNCLLAN